MIAHLSEEPLRKVTLNLFDRDVETLERYYGHGWSAEVRNLVRQRASVIRGRRE